MTAVALAERALRPLDEVRRFALRALAADWPPVRALAARRSVRVPALLVVHALGALALSVLAPSFLLAVGPLAFGVPHLAADVRHLLVRRAWSRWWLWASAAFALSLIALRALAEAGVGRVPLPFEHALAAAWVLLGAAGGAAARGDRPDRTTGARAWAVLAGAGALAAFAVGAPRTFRMALLHGHNLVAIGIWLVVFRRQWRLTWLPVAIVLAGAAALASGVAVAITVRHGVLQVFGLHLCAAADWLAPGLPDGPALAITTSFAFLQSIHYAIWLIAIPAADRPGDGGARGERPGATSAAISARRGRGWSWRSRCSSRSRARWPWRRRAACSCRSRRFTPGSSWRCSPTRSPAAPSVSRPSHASRHERFRDVLDRRLAARVRGHAARRGSDRDAAARSRRAQRAPPDRDRGRREPGDSSAGLVPVPGARARQAARLALSEAWALLAEIAIYRLVWPSLSGRRAALVSLAANGASVAAGFALARFWR